MKDILKMLFGGNFQAGVYENGGYFDGAIPKVNTYMTNYAMGGSLQAHGIKEGDTFLRTIYGTIQKAKDKNGNIVYINLANGERDTQPPLPFNRGGSVANERKHVNKDEDYEVRYSKPRPQRKGYKELRNFKTGGGIDDKDTWQNLLEQFGFKKGRSKYGLDMYYKRGYIASVDKNLRNVDLMFEDDVLYKGYSVQGLLDVLENQFGKSKMATGGALVANQKRIDMNKNGKIDAEDFKLLRASMNGAWRNERKHVNHSEDYEVRYAKPRPNRTGYKGKRKFGEGGGISNFERLSRVVAKNYEGKRVKPQYQKEYGKVYSKSEAKEVGNRVAGKVKMMQSDKKVFGGIFNNANKIINQSKKYPNLSGKDIYLKSGDYVQVFEQNDEKLTVLSFSKMGTGQRPYQINISEVDPTSYKMGGQIKNQKMNNGAEVKKGNRGGIMVLAKQIRKEGESWKDALKRAGQQRK